MSFIRWAAAHVDNHVPVIFTVFMNHYKFEGITDLDHGDDEYFNLPRLQFAPRPTFV